MSEFEEYVQKYAALYGITVEEAKSHEIVKVVQKTYESKEKDVFKGQNKYIRYDTLVQYSKAHYLVWVLVTTFFFFV